MRRIDLGRVLSLRRFEIVNDIRVNPVSLAMGTPSVPDREDWRFLGAQSGPEGQAKMASP